MTVMSEDATSPVATAIGRQYSLVHLYDRAKSPKNWMEKVLHHRDGEILGRWSAKDSRIPRPGARAWSFDGALVAEWDEELYPEGMAVLPSASATPYALIPRDPGAEVWRSVTLAYVRMSSKNGGCSDRLDYTETDFRLWVCLAPHELRDTGRQYALITLPRISAGEFAGTEARQ